MNPLKRVMRLCDVQDQSYSGDLLAVVGLATRHFMIKWTAPEELLEIDFMFLEYSKFEQLPLPFVSQF